MATREQVSPAIVASVDNRPDPEWIRGRCPVCGEAVVSNAYYVGGRGYLIVWECWASLQEPALCGFRRVL
jgi:hypothetical protein